jgi:N-acetylgalactosamine-6-sulfatase
MRFSHFFLPLFAAAGALLGGAGLAADAPKPNVIFLFADDLGYADLHCFGHPYARTPALDQLATDGAMFRNFHVTGVTCCPSRTGFMTGKFPATYRAYPAEHGFGDRVTVTELLKKAGYATGHFGKWHIGPDTKPGTYGIDEIGTEKGQDPIRGRDAKMYDDAIAFVTAHKDVPFYMDVWDHISHNPVDPPKAYAEKFNDITVNEADFAKSPTELEKFALVRKAGGDLDQHMRNYLGEVLSMDDSIGRLLAKLDELGLRDKTMVVFSSDQGAAPLRIAPELGGADDRRNRKLSTNAHLRDIRLNMLGYSGIFRGGKHNMYEGGVRVPLIIRWPGHVPAGLVDEKSLTCGIDWLPTLCKLAGAPLPAGVDFDGEDVSDIWLGHPRERTKPLFWKVSNTNSPIAILEGTWKLIEPGGKRKGPTEVELYDLSKDPGEQTNVAKQNPAILGKLDAKLRIWNATLPQSYDHSGEARDDK